MATPRFFVSPDTVRAERVALADSLAHQVRHVMRLQPGARIILLDNSGWEYELELESLAGAQVQGRIVERRRSAREPRAQLQLYLALLKLDKFEWVLQKGTELGIAAFRPLVSARVVRAELSAQKLERWQRIVREAAEQSERGRVPTLAEPIAFEQALREMAADTLSLLAYEGERTQTLRASLQAHRAAERINLLIGPEGGFEAEEVALARARGVTPVTLGPRILRAETAALVAASAIYYELGELE